MEGKNFSYNSQLIECPAGCGGYIERAYDEKVGRYNGKCGKCGVSFCWRWFE